MISVNCENCNIEITGKTKYNTASLDRIDNSKGYTKDNVVYCLNSINMLKSSHNIEDIKRVFRGIFMKEKTNINVKVKKLFDDSQLPNSSDEFSAGYDLYVHRIEDCGEYIKIFTGISLTPELGYYFMLVPRSSSFKRGITLFNNLGIIDVNYTGEIIGIFLKTKEYKNDIKKGDRLLQLIPQEQIWCEFIEVQELSETERGSGGFGSTGK